MMFLATALVAVLAGRVVEDHTGNPLASVDLRVARPGVAMLAAELETGADGRFRGEGLPEGEYRIRISKPNYVSVERKVSLPLDAPLEVRLVRTGVISGRVSGQDSQPVNGAMAALMQRPTGGGPLRRVGQWVAVGEQGQYRLHGLAPGEYVVAVTYGASTPAVGGTGRANVKAGLGSGMALYPSTSKPQVFGVKGGEDYRGIDFVVVPGPLADVSGKVVSERTGAGSFWVAPAPVDEPAIAMAVAQTRPDGAFTLPGVPVGSYYLSAAGPSRARTMDGGHLEADPQFGRSRLDVAGQPLKDIPLTLSKGRTATFVLRSKDASCPAKGRLSLKSLEDWATVLDTSAELSQDKPQSVANLAPSKYLITVIGEGCAGPENLTLDLSGSGEAKPLEITLAPEKKQP